jgi:hypothetical protein
MIHVELVGDEEHGTGTYTATAETEASVNSDESAETLIQDLAMGCAQQYTDAVDSPGEIESITVTLSPEDGVSPALEDHLTNKWDVNDVSVRYGEVPA